MHFYGVLGRMRIKRVSNMCVNFVFFAAPMCWLGIVFGILLCITGIGIKKSDGTYVRPILWQKRAKKA